MFFFPPRTIVLIYNTNCFHWVNIRNLLSEQRAFNGIIIKPSIQFKKYSPQSLFSSKAYWLSASQVDVKIRSLVKRTPAPFWEQTGSYCKAKAGGGSQFLSELSALKALDFSQRCFYHDVHNCFFTLFIQWTMNHCLGWRVIDNSRGFLFEKQDISTFNLPNWFKETVFGSCRSHKESLFSTDSPQSSPTPFYFLQLAITSFAACK